MKVDHTSSRRRFVKTFALGSVSGGLCGAGWGTALLSEISAQGASNIGLFKMRLADFAALNADNGSVRVKVPGMPTSFGQILVTRLAGAQFFAVTSICTHQGCTVNTYSAGSSSLNCPCHGSRFKADGTLLAGPANRALQKYTTTFNSAESELTIEIPGLAFRLQTLALQPAGTAPARVKLTFPTSSGLKYEVRFRPSLTSAWAKVTFATTQTGAATQSVLTATGATVSLYVDRTTETGFFSIVRY